MLASPSANRGWLKNGNPTGDYRAAPRCAAKTRLGGCCAQPAMRNGRCRFHGGKSTGARTAAGRARCARARRTHGFYSAETVALRREARVQFRRMRALLAAVPGRPVRAAGPRRTASPRGAFPAATSRPDAVGLPTSGFRLPHPAGHGVLPSFLRSALGRAARWLGLRPREPSTATPVMPARRRPAATPFVLSSPDRTEE